MRLNEFVVAGAMGIGILFLSSGCAHIRPESNPPRALEQVLRQSDEGDKTASSDQPIIINGVRLKHTHFDIPITINSQVEKWVSYFTGKGRPFFEKYLERADFFIPYMVPILRQNGMPADFVYLSMVESGFNNLARSRATAVGPWQFMSATGKRYGLMVNWWVDERRDIRKSTLAAVQYLKDLKNMFQTWELAAAAYNAGETKVARAIQYFGTRDFWVIASHRYLKRETRDYVPKIIAAALISKNREQFGFPAKKDPRPGAGEAIAGDGQIVEVIQKSEAALTADDPSEKDLDELDDSPDSADDEEIAQAEITPATLTVPLSGSEKIQLATPVPTPHVTKSGEVGGEQIAEFEVQSPADLLQVARAAGLSYQTVKSLNPELLRWCTPPNVGSYRIKLPAFVKDRFLTTYNREDFPRQVRFMAYKVHRGDTLARIAHHYGIKVDPITDLNGVSPRMRLRKGLRVLLPIPNDRSRSLASLDLRDPPSRRRHHRRHRHHRHKYYRVSYKRRESARSVSHWRGGDT